MLELLWLWLFERTQEGGTIKRRGIMRCYLYTSIYIGIDRFYRKKRDMAAIERSRYTITSNQSVVTYFICSIKTKRKDGSEIWMICDTNCGIRSRPW